MTRERGYHSSHRTWHGFCIYASLSLRVMLVHVVKKDCASLEDSSH